MNGLIIDAYDSFVYVIMQYLASAGAQCTVVRNDKLAVEDIADMAPDFILLGPGPGHPKDAHYLPIIDAYASRIPIMGVCLGHQAIGLAFGGSIGRASHLMHGKTSRIEHDGKGIFAGCPQALTGTRYHSLLVDAEQLPECLEVTARDADHQYIMGLRHRELPIESVQFHPESITTEHGMRLFENFLDSAKRFAPA